MIISYTSEFFQLFEKKTVQLLLLLLFTEVNTLSYT